MEFSFRRCRRTARQALQGRALAAAAVRWMPAAVFALLAAGEAGACRLGSALPLAAGAEAYWIPAMAGAFTLALWGVFFPVFWGMRRWFP